MSLLLDMLMGRAIPPDEDGPTAFGRLGAGMRSYEGLRTQGLNPMTAPAEGVTGKPGIEQEPIEPAVRNPSGISIEPSPITTGANRPAPQLPKASGWERIAAALSATQGKGLLPALGGVMGAGPAIDKKEESDNLTYNALIGKGIDPATARAAIGNPALLQQVLPQAFAPKGFELAEGAARYDLAGNEIARNTPKLTGAEKDYEFYRRQELGAKRAPKSFHDWQLSLRQAGATAITVDQGGEKSFAKKVGELQAGDFQELVKRGRDAKTIISDLAALREIGSRITTGKTAEIAAALGPYAEALGVKIDGLEDMQAFRAITSRLAPRMRAPGSGATSDFEMRTFLESLPNLGRTPGGNEIVANVFQALQENDIRTAEIASQALSGEISAKDAEKMIRALPNPFEAFTKSRGKTPTAQPGSSTPDSDGWITLPDGTRYREVR